MLFKYRFVLSFVPATYDNVFIDYFFFKICLFTFGEDTYECALLE